MSDRIPVDGVTVDAEPHPLGEYALRGPTGEVLMWATAADLADLGISFERHGCWCSSCDQMHRNLLATAAALRKYADLLDAIGDPSDLRRWVDDYNGIMLRKLGDRIAAVLDGRSDRE